MAGIAQRLLNLESRVTALEDALNMDAATKGTHLDVLPDRIVTVLHAAGYDTPQAVQAATDDDLLDVDGIGDASLKDIRDVFPTT